jgi:DNA polymerase III subunit alpha
MPDQDPNNFVHCHLHTEYSLLDGINRVETLPEYIKGLGQTACAITDHGNISGAYKFFKSCRKAEIKPIIGMESYYTVNDRTAREKDEDGQACYHLVLLAQNNVGLHNLIKLSSHAYTEGLYHKPRIDDALLADHSEGILATSACLGSRSSQLILKGRKAEAEKLLDHHAEIFKDRWFIEVQLHVDEEQQAVNKALIEIANKKGWPLLLTNDCHYTHSDDKLVHEQALCMQTNDVMYNDKRFSFGPIDVHVAHHDWMWSHAKEIGLPYDAVKNSSFIANMIDDSTYFTDVRNRYPRYQGLPPDLPSWDALRKLAYHNLASKMDGNIPSSYSDRLEAELKVIKKMGFYDYLLIVWEFLNGARSEGVWVGPGRGSAAGSLVAYALDITQIDPIKYGLVFERWLNYGRASTPLIFDRDMIDKIEKYRQPEHDRKHSKVDLSQLGIEHSVEASNLKGIRDILRSGKDNKYISTGQLGPNLKNLLGCKH